MYIIHHWGSQTEKQSRRQQKISVQTLSIVEWLIQGCSKLIFTKTISSRYKSYWLWKSKKPVKVLEPFSLHWVEPTCYDWKVNWKLKLKWTLTFGRRKQLVTFTRKIWKIFWSVEVLQWNQKGVNVSMWVNNEEKVIADTEKAKFFVEFYVQDGNSKANRSTENSSWRWICSERGSNNGSGYYWTSFNDRCLLHVKQRNHYGWNNESN